MHADFALAQIRLKCPEPNSKVLYMKKKILLADDDAGVRNTLRRVLESENYEVVTSANGRETAAKFTQELPDLVLLDLNMPDRDGWDVFKSMSADHPLVPVIIITAQPQQYEQAADLGVDAIMEKPLDLPCLLKTIAEYLAESEKERIQRLTRPDYHTVFLPESGGHSDKISQ